MRDIPTYEGLYSVTQKGRVWSHPKATGNGVNHQGKFLKPWLIGHGYETVMLYRNKKSAKYLVHRLVASAFIDNPDNLREVNHKNANRLDNRAANLEWVTSSQNKQHAIRKGLYRFSEYKRLRGTQHPRAKFTNRDIRTMRRLRARGITYASIGRKYSTSKENVSHIVRRLTWKHIV